jgi:hypothetical protein
LPRSYLTTLSVWRLYRSDDGMTDELEKIWKESVLN